ncbi:hypothetical protein TrLO_g11742 [Triparma laevis f. longispina]|uniref:Uncharacterized protein n=1 Tax=Triparma laevis f. longispina TaxID=1714387 RepID=A0A9W7BZW9_9STRA|nr:hypothetical protein TrLO_g11742 [Triparma laevis f. longispina]
MRSRNLRPQTPYRPPKKRPEVPRTSLTKRFHIIATGFWTAAESGVIFCAEISLPDFFNVLAMIQKLKAFPATTEAQASFKKLVKSGVLIDDVVGVILSYLLDTAVLKPLIEVRYEDPNYDSMDDMELRMNYYSFFGENVA